jgi:hypothetical protein
VEGLEDRISERSNHTKARTPSSRAFLYGLASIEPVKML